MTGQAAMDGHVQATATATATVNAFGIGLRKKKTKKKTQIVQKVAETEIKTKLTTVCSD